MTTQATVNATNASEVAPTATQVRLLTLCTRTLQAWMKPSSHVPHFATASSLFFVGYLR